MGVSARAIGGIQMCIGCCRLDPAHRVVEEGDEIAGDTGDNGMNETRHHE